MNGKDDGNKDNGEGRKREQGRGVRTEIRRMRQMIEREGGQRKAFLYRHTQSQLQHLCF